MKNQKRDLSYVVKKYKDEQCKACIRSPICTPSELDMIQCRLNSFFKGIMDWRFISQYERARIIKNLDAAPEIKKGLAANGVNIETGVCLDD